MKIFANSVGVVLGLLLSASVWSHPGHGLDAGLFHTEVHTLWSLVIFVAVVLVALKLMQGRKSK